MKRWVAVVWAIVYTTAASTALHSLESISNKFDRKHSLSILIVSYPFSADGYRMLALGEELVERGHNVSFSSTVNWERFDRIAMERNMTFLNAGRLSVSENDFLRIHREMITNLNSLQTFNPITVARSVQNLVRLTIHQIVSYLDKIALQQWDVVVMPEAFANSVTCLAQRDKVPAVVVLKRLVVGNHQPQWPFPSPQSSSDDDMSFLDRLSSAVEQPLLQLFMHYYHPYRLPLTDPTCDAVFQSSLPECHEYPCLVVSPFGFEFARTVNPMVEFVGPILLKQNTMLPSKASTWLTTKKDRRIIYVDLGEYLDLTSWSQAMVDGLLSTEYDVMWNVLSNELEELERLELDSERFFVMHANTSIKSKLLQYPSVIMALLHGENLLLLEALYNAIPVVVVPFGGDQHGNAARVRKSGAGALLSSNNITAVAIRESINAIASSDFHRAAQRVRKIFLQAGGVERAADLVELYGDVGYQHLVPAYIKYQWSWIQYYNTDVCLLLSISIICVVYCSGKVIKFCCSCCRCCCSATSKKYKTL